MKKFWKWMKDKSYALDVKDLALFTQEMLIGYMLEYIRDHKWWDDKNVQEILRGDIGMKLDILLDCRDQYSKLVSIIKEMDGEE